MSKIKKFFCSYYFDAFAYFLVFLYCSHTAIHFNSLRDSSDDLFTTGGCFGVSSTFMLYCFFRFFCSLCLILRNFLLNKFRKD